MRRIDEHLAAYVGNELDALVFGVPTSGHLAFFYFDGAYDDFETTVGTWDPSSGPGFRVMHLQRHQSNTTEPAPPPPHPPVFPPVTLTAVRTVTWPSHEAPIAEFVWEKSGLLSPRPGVPASPVQGLYDAFWELPGGGHDTHQIGGHACPQQGPVELRRGLLGEPFEWADSDVHSAASDWCLLLQVASDEKADMMWGDVGQLYYLIRRDASPEDALFTWQCG